MGTVSAAIGSAIDGKYRVVRHLGTDGQVERYLAEHTSIRRAVEVHCLAADAPPSGEAAAQLLRTARALGSATHRNLQSVVDSGRDAAGRPYVVFEALRGESLAQLVASGRALDRRRASRIAMQVLEAVRELHDAGVVLRALTPLDVSIEPVSAGEELVKVRAGRGAALIEERDAAGLALRLPAYSVYLAPELRRGDPGLDPRVDLYSVGVLLRELLTGSARGDLDRLSDAARRALARACAEDPDERFATADGFLQAVALLLPTSDRPPREQLDTPTDPLHADLQYLHLRRSARPWAPAVPSDGTLELLPVLLVIEAIYRRFGPEVWAELGRRVPEAESLLPGAGNTPVHLERGVPCSLFARVLSSVDGIAGRGDLGLVVELGEAVARRGLRRLFPDLPVDLRPAVLVAGWPHLHRCITKEGRAQVLPGGEEHTARLAVEGQRAPTLELTALIGGLLRQALREAGARQAEVVVIAAQALGDGRDLYGLAW